MEGDTVVFDSKTDTTTFLSRLEYKTLMMVDTSKIYRLYFQSDPKQSYDDLSIKNAFVNNALYKKCIGMRFNAKKLKLDDTAVVWDLEKGNLSIDLKRYIELCFPGIRKKPRHL